MDFQSADVLFSKSVDLLNNTSEKIMCANDSDEVLKLLEEFDKKITEINFSLPPETDLKLTEQQNDSIINLMLRMRSLAAKKYIDFQTSFLSASDSLQCVK